MTGVPADLDLLARTADLVDVASPSFEESALVDLLEPRLRALAHLDVHRIGDNLVARTELGRPVRVVVGGHSDTVPPNGNLPSRSDGDTLWGLGTADMKGGLAVMLALAERHAAPAVESRGSSTPARRSRPSTAGWANCSSSAPTSSRPTSRYSASPRTASWRPVARERSGSRSSCAAPGPIPPVRGWAVTPCTVPPGCSVRSMPTSPVVP